MCLMARRLSLYHQKVLSPQALAMVALIAIDNNLCVDIHCHQWIVIHVIDIHEFAYGSIHGYP